MRQAFGKSTVLILLIATALTIPARAEMQGRIKTEPGSGVYDAYYDTDLHITWARDSLLAGQCYWFPDATNRVAGLMFHGIVGWRLPNVDVNGDGVIAAQYDPCPSAEECLDNEPAYFREMDGYSPWGQPGPFIWPPITTLWTHNGCLGGMGAIPSTWATCTRRAFTGTNAITPVRCTTATSSWTISTATITWEDQAASAGTSTLYDLASGYVSDMQSDGGFASLVCFASGLADPFHVDDREILSQEALYYLVRSYNSCGAGTHGAGRRDLDISPACIIARC